MHFSECPQLSSESQSGLAYHKSKKMFCDWGTMLAVPAFLSSNKITWSEVDLIFQESGTGRS